MKTRKKFAFIPHPRFFACDDDRPGYSFSPVEPGKTAGEVGLELLRGQHRENLSIKQVEPDRRRAVFGIVPGGFSASGGYALNIDEEGVAVCSNGEAGLRNAFQTLAQLIVQSGDGRLPCARIIDWPRMNVRCAHICHHLAMDWMPESVPGFKALLETVKMLANYKYNAILLEIESMFPYKTNPRLSSSDAFSRDEIEELKSLCAELGVEIIPLLQCLGHAYNVLRLPEYSHLRETPDTSQQYCPSNPGARKLYSELAGEVIEAFKPLKRFHIGGDESRRLGVCRECGGKAALKGYGVLYGEHVGAAAADIARRGVAPLVWSDMVEKYPGALSFLPGEAEIVYWKYSLEKLVQHGAKVDFRRFGARKTWAAAGVRFGTCNHTMYRCHESMQGISFLAREAGREGCSNWIATDWMKAVPYELSAFGQAFAAEEGWNGGRSMTDFSGAYTKITFGVSEENWAGAYEGLEELLPYCEDAEKRQYDFIDRYDLSGLSFRERIAGYISTGSREDARKRIEDGMSGALSSLDILSSLENKGLKRNKREFEILKLSALTHRHKARLGGAIDKAAALLKFPSPGDEKKRSAIADEFEELISEHDALRGETERLLAPGLPKSHCRNLLNVKFEPAARKWMEYFRNALLEYDYLPSLLIGPIEE